jgi:hypothetical protein
MSEQELTIAYRLSTQRALLGVITPNIRMITIGWDGLTLFKMRAYFGEPPTEDEIEEIDDACAEVLADMLYQRDEVECIHDTRPKKDLEVLKVFVYARKE